MRPPISKYFLSSMLVLFILSAQAQDKKKDAADSLRKFRLPTGVRVGTDLIAIGKTLYGSPLTGWELNADVDFGRYYLALDYGSSSRKDSIDNGYYTNDGRYFRAGVDVNFLLKDPDRNMFFMGLRYGQSSYSEQLTYAFTANEFGEIQKVLSNPDAKATWGELTICLRVKIWKYLWMGYTARMKFLPIAKNTQELETWDIPGYGKTSKSVYWGFNYQIFVRIPFKKEKINAQTKIPGVGK